MYYSFSSSCILLFSIDMVSAIYSTSILEWFGLYRDWSTFISSYSIATLVSLLQIIYSIHLRGSILEHLLSLVLPMTLP